MACTYQSITLKEGDTFVLPPGASLVYATDPNLLTSENDCAADDLAKLETPVCYKFKFSGIEGGAARLENWEAIENNFNVLGIIVGDIYYPFTSSIQGWQTGASFQTAMNGIAEFAGVFTSFANIIGDESGAGGWTNQVNFTTIPSIGDNLQFKIMTSTEWQTPFSGQQTYAYVKGELCG